MHTHIQTGETKFSYILKVDFNQKSQETVFFFFYKCQFGASCYMFYIVLFYAIQ